MKHAVIIGGGVIGLATAYYLRKASYEVTLIEKNEIGEGCSDGNLGWVCPTLSRPLPEPGLIPSTIKGMAKRNSPLYIRPSALFSISKWTYQFWRKCNIQAYESGVDVGLSISRYTLELFDQLKKEEALDFELYDKGLLFVSKNQEELEEKYKGFKIGEKIGLNPPELKTKEEILKMEPHLSDDIIGGVYLPNERHVRPESFNLALKDWLKTKGATLLNQTEVLQFKQENGNIQAVQTHNKEIRADIFIITAGVESRALLKKLKTDVPMTAGKGYNVTFENPNINLNYPLYFGDGGMSPYENSLRVGGTMELSGINTYLDQKRLKSLEASLSSYLKTDITGELRSEWVGMRPMTPDGLPVIGPLATVDNGYIATGHVMSGVSMSLATGYILKELIVNNNKLIDFSKVSPNRF